MPRIAFEDDNGPLIKDLIGVLTNLLDCGLLHIVSNAISHHIIWFDDLTGSERHRAMALRERLAEMSSKESHLGIGSLIDLDHPIVKAPTTWTRLSSEMIANATLFRASGQRR